LKGISQEHNYCIHQGITVEGKYHHETTNDPLSKMQYILPATMAWCILRRWTEETAPRLWRVAADILNKQLWTANKG
jgi:hypothetical protein